MQQAATTVWGYGRRYASLWLLHRVLMSYAQALFRTVRIFSLSTPVLHDKNFTGYLYRDTFKNSLARNVEVPG